MICKGVVDIVSNGTVLSWQTNSLSRPVRGFKNRNLVGYCQDSGYVGRTPLAASVKSFVERSEAHCASELAEG